jgi:membrane-associated phospholipid phosphatase
MNVGLLATVLADAAVVVLVLGHVVLSNRHWPRVPMRVVISSVAVVIAWLTSELVKVSIRAPRPCHEIVVSGSCPGPSDWSMPSNHATIAGALATCWLLFSPRTAPLACLLALAVAGARVVEGVHHTSDVAAGLALGAAVVWLADRTYLWRRSTGDRTMDSS